MPKWKVKHRDHAMGRDVDEVVDADSIHDRPEAGFMDFVRDRGMGGGLLVRRFPLKDVRAVSLVEEES